MQSQITLRFLECLEELLDAKVERSYRQFALALDYLPQSLSEITRGNRDVTIELLRKAVEVYHFNPDFLLAGVGERRRDPTADVDLHVLTTVKDQSGQDLISHVPLAAQSEYVNRFSDPQFVRGFQTYRLPGERFAEGHFRSFTVEGDAMEPTLFKTDTVICSLVEPAQWKTGLKDNYVYLVVTRHAVLIKRLCIAERDGEMVTTIELRSDNTFYEPQRLSLKDVKEMWLVESRLTPFLPSPDRVGDIIRSEITEMRDRMRVQSDQISSLLKHMNVKD